MKIKFAILVILLGFTTSCERFLEEKPDINMVVPESPEDLRALLDISQYMNISPQVLEISSDDYYLDASDWNALASPTDRNLYIWNEEVYKEARSDGAWMNCYVQVYYANVVIHTIESGNMLQTEKAEAENLLGAALFYRAKAFFEIAQIWANPYDRESSENLLGIPLRLSPDFNVVSTRSTLRQTYEQILSDLTNAIELLRYDPSEHVNRPNQCAAFAMLARVYLTMGEFKLAAEMAEKALALKSVLLDYNDLDKTAQLPFKRFNEEVIFNSYMTSSTPIMRAKIDSMLYKSYEVFDLRKDLFFNRLPSGGYGFKGNYYEDNSIFFNGLTTAELYVICAEAYMVMGHLSRSSDFLNQLLLKRYVQSEFSPYDGSEPNYENIVLGERRKELVFRGLRWSDVRRYNTLGRDILMERNIDGERFFLRKGSPRFTVPIPESVISISGIQQNP